MRLLDRLIRLVPWLTVALVGSALLLLLLVRTERSVEAAGTVRVERYQVVRPEIPGIVEEVLVELGSRVQPGDVLVRLTAGEEREQRLAAERELEEVRLRHRRLQQQLAGLETRVHPLELGRKRLERASEDLRADAAATSLTEEEIQLAAVRSRLERAQRLADAGLLSEQQLDEARLELRLARQRFNRSEIESRLAHEQLQTLDTDIELRRAEQRVERQSLVGEIDELGARIQRLTARVERLAQREAARVVRARVPGIVADAEKRELLGRWVAAGDDLMIIIVPDSIGFVAEVSEAEVLRVRPGQPVRVEISGLSRQRFAPFAGRVEAVGQRPSGSDRVVYPVTIRLATPWAESGGARYLLRDGMRGTARIAYRSDVPLYLALFELIAGERA